MDEMHRSEVLSRLKNIKGHIAGIERMVQENQSCGNILLQLSAIRASIEKTGIYILENNAIDCLTNDMECSPSDRQKLEMTIKQILTFLR